MVEGIFQVYNLCIQKLADVINGCQSQMVHCHNYAY